MDAPSYPFPNETIHVDEDPRQDIIDAHGGAAHCAVLMDAVQPPLCFNFSTDAEPVPEDSISNFGISVDAQMVEFEAGSATSVGHASHASFISADDVGKCFLEGSLLPDGFNRLCRVEHLQQFDHVKAENGQLMRVQRITPHPGPHEVVALQAGPVYVRMTSSHKVLILRGHQRVAAPASSLRIGDDIVCGEGVVQLMQQPVLSTEDVCAYEITFDPHLPIETFSEVPRNAILTMGRRPPKPRRSGRPCQLDRVSIASTPNSFD